ncbi:fimbrial protein [Serratia marcescens]|uniref:Minor fimbrial protein prsF n=1 Tax=Serratia marcescens TaxID=615 RepID=A0A379Y6H3_SERMA|nr:fimbrial protein [Serratia marcescens]KFD16122.1 MrfF family protein [Serratia marcescens subsp. marcescens ATCC 13880]MBY4850682.1 fimbrial protein [Serratia marcescens]MCC3251007.1 fimbrial protein [Serratia marcescens]MCH9868930.1 fimbrial protein [Serratia marcescens]PNU43443.1 exotoxin [Serratia marcescens subsp. marcescens ATCC 13880]
MNGIVTLQRALAGVLAALPMLACAAPSATVTVKVTVVAPPPCVINDDRPVEVEFGDVMTTRVDGDNYKMPVNYTLSCSGGTSNAMKLQVKGNGAAFDATVLQTNKTGLGIELRQGDGKLAVNSWLNFTYPNKPELWAVPVKQAGTTLTGGEFSAGATMAVDYQ